MKKFRNFYGMLALVALVFAQGSSVASSYFLIEQPKIPKSLIRE